MELCTQSRLVVSDTEQTRFDMRALEERVISNDFHERWRRSRREEKRRGSFQDKN